MKKQIFAIDDEIDIQEIIKINLISEGYEVLTFSSAEEALADIKNSIPDLIILDVMMQGIDGYEFCRQLRSSKEYRNIPIIFLSAKSEEFDKVLGLELGGDDYITKPFSIKELKSRVKAILRRATTASSQEAHIIQYKGIELNSASFSLAVDGEDVPLTKTEFNILTLFLTNPGKIFSRDNIIDSTRGTDVYVIDRTIDVHIMNLRKKLGVYKDIIKTFSGVGYGFREIK
jgi:two-component system, OmpR family, alkaline phosphatase synthesis response regulator PhoP